MEGFTPKPGCRTVVVLRKRERVGGRGVLEWGNSGKGYIYICKYIIKNNHHWWTFCYSGKMFRNFTILIRSDHLEYSYKLEFFSWSLVPRFESQLSIGYWQRAQQLLSVPGYYLVPWCILFAVNSLFRFI